MWVLRKFLLPVIVPLVVCIVGATLADDCL